MCLIIVVNLHIYTPPDRRDLHSGIRAMCVKFIFSYRWWRQTKWYFDPFPQKEILWVDGTSQRKMAFGSSNLPEESLKEGWFKHLFTWVDWTHSNCLPSRCSVFDAAVQGT